MLHLCLLGRFEVTQADRPHAALRSPRLQSFLAYLLLHRGQVLPRRQVAATFWPDEPDGTARNNLRQMVHQLRRALPQVDHFLIADALTLRWHSDAELVVDVDEFEQALAQAEVARAAGDLPALQQSLERAATVYRGDLLPDCYDDWVMPERERLQRQHLAGLAQLADLLEQQRDITSALPVAQRLTAADPMDEDAHLRMMRLHALSNDRAGALRIYQTYAERLHREMGIAPGAALSQARERLLGEASSTPAHAAYRTVAEMPAPLIGRQHDIDSLVGLLEQPETRLVTLLGPPGIGKTRLALAVAQACMERFDHGAIFVPLAAVNDPHMMPDAILQALGITSTASDPLLQLKHALHGRDLLLVLDNLEQLLVATDAHTTAAIIAGLVEAAPHVKILITSRARVRLSNEHGYEVAVLTGQAAAELFTTRARMQQPTFRVHEDNEDAAIIAEICRRLDHMPLAIELAAARVRVFQLPELLNRLSAPLEVLNFGPQDLAPRQRTLRNAIDWSYRLLTPDEQTLFRRLATFADGCTLEMIEALTARELSLQVVDLVQSLVDKSLLQPSHSNWGVRFRYLESIRAYAAERLTESNEADRIAEEAAKWFVDQVESAQGNLSVCESIRWFEWVDIESNNVRQAIQWSMRTGKIEYGMRLAANLANPWRYHGPLRDGAQLITDLLAHPNARRDLHLYGQVLLAGASLAYGGGSIAQTEQFGLAAQKIFESLGDWLMAGRAMAQRASAVDMLGQSAFALQIITTSCLLAATTNDKHGLAIALIIKGCLTRDPKHALSHFAEAITLASEIESAMCVFFGCWLQYGPLLKLDKLDAAKASLQKALEMGMSLGMTSSTYSVRGGLCEIAIYQGDIERAVEHGRYAVEGSSRHGSAYMRGLNLTFLGLAEHLCGYTERGEAMLREALEIHRKYGRHSYIPACLSNLACIAADTGRHARATLLFAAAEVLRVTHDQDLYPAQIRLFASRMEESIMNMTEADLQACRAEGAEMNFDTAVTFALTSI